uniref:Porin-like n=1 Tax=Oryza rufipogon TaxID=4529 RepID=A0A1V1H338_ORYRU|nr:porin-like [Oryza rufipogon]
MENMLDRDNMVSEQSIHGIPIREMQWTTHGGSDDCWGQDLSHGGDSVRGARQVFDEMPSRLGSAAGAALHVQVNHLIYPVSTNVMHQVFNPYGAVAVQMLAVDAWRVEAIVWFRTTCDAEWAQDELHGRNIYDGGCVLDVQHVPTSLEDRADTAPTKCSMQVPGCATTKSDTESTPTTLEHVFPATMSLSAASTKSAVTTTSVSLTEAMEAEASMDKVVENAGKAIQDLCTRIDRILEAFHDTKVDLSENKDSTRDVAELSANTSPTTIALEVSAEAGPTNHVDLAKLGMGTTIECSMKGKNQLVDDDGKDMANDERTELIEVDTKFTSVNLCFRDPWLALNAIPSRILIGCLSHDLGVNSLSLVPSTLEVPYHCFVLGSVCRASSPPVPLWRVAVPWYSDQVFSGSRPSPWPDPWLYSGNGSVVVFQPLQPWPPPLQAKSKGSIVERQLEPWHDPQIKQDNRGVVVNLLQPRLSPDRWNESWFSCDNAWELTQSHCKLLLTEHMALMAHNEENRLEQNLSLCVKVMFSNEAIMKSWDHVAAKRDTDYDISPMFDVSTMTRLLARINLLDSNFGQVDMQTFQASANVVTVVGLKYSPLVVRMAFANHLHAPWDPGGSNLDTLLHVRKDRQQPQLRPLQNAFPDSVRADMKPLLQIMALMTKLIKLYSWPASGRWGDQVLNQVHELCKCSQDQSLFQFTFSTEMKMTWLGDLETIKPTLCMSIKLPDCSFGRMELPWDPGGMNFVPHLHQLEGKLIFKGRGMSCAGHGLHSGPDVGCHRKGGLAQEQVIQSISTHSNKRKGAMNYFEPMAAASSSSSSFSVSSSSSLEFSHPQL